LIVHAIDVAGPQNSTTGRALFQAPMKGTGILVREANGTPTIATTDDHGNVRFLLAPGRYVVRLAYAEGFNGKVRDNHAAECPSADSANVRVLSHRLVRAAVECVDGG
jgi:hypothetical protein